MTTPDTHAPEPITAIEAHTIPKLSERAIGQMTYRIGIGASGTVYLAVAANQGGGYFSPEWVSITRLQEILAPYQSSGDSFPTPVLRAAYVNRSANNGGFLAAILRHTGLLTPGDPPHLHVALSDWSAWETRQRDQFDAGVRLENTSDESPKKRLTRQRARKDSKGSATS
ncbi:hypothetical protein [Thiorhodococcus fuscus]|uniref:Uncharacterized protein n=1 Tax=Thiorhodococcus fuscus TaxID=527200 RepID=A0ABW4Y7T1_9GAMM